MALALLTALLLTLLTTYFCSGGWRYTFFVLINQTHCYMPKLNDIQSHKLKLSCFLTLGFWIFLGTSILLLPVTYKLSRRRCIANLPPSPTPTSSGNITYLHTRDKFFNLEIFPSLCRTLTFLKFRFRFSYKYTYIHHIILHKESFESLDIQCFNLCFYLKSEGNYMMLSWCHRLTSGTIVMMVWEMV